MATSQALRLNLIVVTSLEHMPAVPISPILPCLHKEVLLLAYNVALPGQYCSVQVAQM